MFWLLRGTGGVKAIAVLGQGTCFKEEASYPELLCFGLDPACCWEAPPYISLQFQALPGRYIKMHFKEEAGSCLFGV